jgi:hypothetical protein
MENCIVLPQGFIYLFFLFNFVCGINLKNKIYYLLLDGMLVVSAIAREVLGSKLVL